jgi:DNA helicase-2/ATP-dependent DNA helicase PcrA
MTRARVDLALSWAQARNPGQAARRKPSRFLDPLLPASARSEPATERRSRVASCRECGKPLRTGAEKKRGRCTDCPASYDEALFERLREWRKERAGEDEVPAFVIFTDATLQLIAEHRPQSTQALLRISGVGAGKLERYGEDVLNLLV